VLCLCDCLSWQSPECALLVRLLVMAESGMCSGCEITCYGTAQNLSSCEISYSVKLKKLSLFIYEVILFASMKFRLPSTVMNKGLIIHIGMFYHL
jgi:hypothetical protein